jgi:hypothetical protein
VTRLEVIQKLEFMTDRLVDKVNDAMSFRNWTTAIKYLKKAEKYDNARYVLEDRDD